MSLPQPQPHVDENSATFYVHNNGGRPFTVKLFACPPGLLVLDPHTKCVTGPCDVQIWPDPALSFREVRLKIFILVPT